MSSSSQGTPLNYPWYHGSITRLQTEEFLMRANKTGSFLVRDSESFKGAYVLSVLCEGRIYQYRILPDGNGFLIKSTDASKQHTFSNVPELIQSYSITNNGLCCPLHYPTEQPKVETEEEQDSDDEAPMSDEDEADSLAAGTSQVDVAVEVLKSRLEHLNLAMLDGPFQERLRDYMGGKAKQDLEEVRAGATTAYNLRQLVLASAKDLTRHVDLFLSKIEALQQLFELSSVPILASPSEKAGRTGSDLKHLFSRLGECQAQVTTLENKAVSAFQDLCKASAQIPATPARPDPELPDMFDMDTATYMGGAMESMSNGTDTLKANPSCIPNLSMVATPFEVKVEGLTVDALKNTKVKLTVDVSLGSLSIMKHYGKDMKEEMTIYSHDKIVQLIKSRVNHTKLLIRFSNGKKKEYGFDDAKKRETFCQLIQCMKMEHSNSKELDQISVFIGTWNMGAAIPPSSITSWLTCQGEGKTRDLSLAAMPHDLYVIGAQEFKSAAISDRDWISRVKMEIARLNAATNKEYVTVSMTSLWGLRLAVLVSPEHEHQISHVRESFVRTGIANTLGNKGAVGTSFHFSGTSFCFINAHLTSGTEKCTRRNNNYHDIIRGLALSSKGLSPFDLTNQFHHLFFLGDLNYRIEWNIPEILRNIAHQSYSNLFDHEQLKREKDKYKIFVDFDEEDITFPPTYRYKVGTRKIYIYKKVKKTMVRINEPSWCDRVIWRSYPGTHIVNTSYGCTTDILTSDHSPVFATFDVGITATTVIPKGTTTQNAQIVFVSAEATIYTSMCGFFYLEFYSNCLEAGVAKSGMNKTCLQQQSGTKILEIHPHWSCDELPKLMPLLSDFDYLEEQHILVAIKSNESEESYGEFVVALKDKISSSPVPFHAVLTHHGHRTGEIKGSLHVKARDESLYGGCRKTKTYELVSFDEKDKTTGDLQSPADKGKRKVKKGPWPKTPGVESPTADMSDVLLNPVSRRRPNGETITTIKLSREALASVHGLKEEMGGGGGGGEDPPPPLPPPRKGSSPATPDVVPSDESLPHPLTKLQPPKQLSIGGSLLSPESGPKLPLRPTLSNPGEPDGNRSRARSPLTTPREERPLPHRPADDSAPPCADPPSHGSASAAVLPRPVKSSLGKVNQLRAQFERTGSEAGSPDAEGASSSSSTVAQEPDRPPLPWRVQEPRPSLEPRPAPLEVLIEGLPPPLPAKMKTPPKSQLADLEEYEMLRRPATIVEWLMNLGLPQYGYQLLNNGWDNVAYLDTITDKDLLHCQIVDSNHRYRMLDSIKNMMPPR